MMFDALKQSGLSLTIIIDNMAVVASLLADVLLDHSALQWPAYRLLCYPGDVQNTHFNRFLIDQISQQSVVIRQKFCWWLVHYQPSLRATPEDCTGKRGRQQWHELLLFFFRLLRYTFIFRICLAVMALHTCPRGQRERECVCEREIERFWQ